MSVNPIPKEYEGLMAYIIVSDAAHAIDFYKKALGAVERMRLPGADGKIGHAELQIGSSVLMMADECAEAHSKSPQTVGATTFCFVLYVADVDAAFRRALDAGATVLQPLEDKFYGDRTGMFTDPFGHQWALMKHIEDVSPEEMNRRIAAMTKK